MIWKIKFTQHAEKQFSKLDKNIQKKILAYLKEMASKSNPRSKGKALSHNMKGLWRFRFGDYRMVCQLIDKELIVLVLKVGQRKHIYH